MMTCATNTRSKQMAAAANLNLIVLKTTHQPKRTHIIQNQEKQQTRARKRTTRKGSVVIVLTTGPMRGMARNTRRRQHGAPWKMTRLVRSQRSTTMRRALSSLSRNGRCSTRGHWRKTWNQPHPWRTLIQTAQPRYVVTFILRTVRCYLF